MKKSEIYKMAQKAVVSCSMWNLDTKLEILKELMSQEDLELFTEQQEERGDNQ